MKGKYKLAILVVVILLIAGFMIFAPGAEKHNNIAIAGSTSVQPVAEKLATTYMENDSVDKLTVQGGGSSMGLNSVKKGSAQIGTYSSKLSSKKAGANVTQTQIATDGIAIIVNPSNNVSDLTKDQVKDIFTGKITDWSQVGGSPGKINVITREEGSGTRDAITKVVLDDEDFVSNAVVQSSTGSLMQSISTDDKAIGFASLSDLRENQVKKLKINGVEANDQTIKDGSYVVQRPFLFLTNKTPDNATQAFINWTLSDEGQQIVAEEGLVPVN
ncbi:MAG: phosphate ABC transporter substrate-binding protein [Methanosphaera sp.]|mgnify:CR=1 FL=1|nr:phosphate ABC transporter substrate-binding protein [Methanosphaera sp.]